MIKLRVQKYILREIIVPMGLGIVVLSFVLLMGNLLRLTDLVINKGVPFKEIALLFFYFFPSFLDIALAMAFLLGILVGFGRLSADSEIIALKASGVSITTMFKPVLLISLIFTLATGWLLYYAKPIGLRSVREQVFNIVNNRLATSLQPMVFFQDFEKVVIFAETVNARTGRLGNIFLSDHRDPTSKGAIFARQGYIFSNPKTLTFSLNLEDGTILHQPADDSSPNLQILRFDKYDINLSFSSKNAVGRKSRFKPMNMTIPEIQKALAEDRSPSDYHLLNIEVHKRMALTFVPLLFALIGMPLGIYSPRSGKFGGFAVSLLVFLTYFVFSSFMETLCRDGQITVYGIIWLPNLLFLVTGAVLFYCACKEKNPFFFLPKVKKPRFLQIRGEGK